MTVKKTMIAGVVAVAVTGLTAACVAFLVALLVVRVLWAWTVPDVFPGAVDQGLVAGSIGWLTAVKIALCVAVLSGLAGSRPRS